MLQRDQDNEHWEIDVEPLDEEKTHSGGHRGQKEQGGEEGEATLEHARLEWTLQFLG